MTLTLRAYSPSQAVQSIGSTAYFCGSRDWKQQYHDWQLLLLTAAIKAIDNVSKSLVRRGSEKDRLAKQIVNAASPTNARG